MKAFLSIKALPRRLLRGSCTMGVLLTASLIPIQTAHGLANSTVQLETVFAFPYANATYPFGVNPLGNVIELQPGVFLTGTTYGKGTCPEPPPGKYPTNSCGKLIKIDTTGSGSPVVSIFHTFDGDNGAYPVGNLLPVDIGGTRYIFGVTEYGGIINANCPNSCGTVFRIKADHTGFTVLHKFTGTDGAVPQAGLILGRDGKIYGTTRNGGSASGYGTVFSLSPPLDSVVPPAFSSQTFHNSNLANGAFPNLPIQPSWTLNLLGTTEGGNLGGALWNFDTSTLSFGTPINDWGTIYTGALAESGGKLFGAMKSATNASFGKVFSFDPTSGTITNLHSFAGGTSDGGSPYAGMLKASDGLLYGTTRTGGSVVDSGTIFGLSPDNGTYTSLHSFASNVDGAFPQSELTEASDGYIYGTLSAYGPGGNASGTVFRFAKAGGQPLWLHQWGQAGQPEGASSLAVDTAGLIYVAGGSHSSLGGQGSGNLFIGRYKPNGDLDPSFGGVNGFIQFGFNSNVTSIQRLFVDLQRNVYVVGYTEGTSFYHLSSAPVKNEGGQDAFIAAFGKAGNLKWVYTFGTPQLDWAMDMAMDDTGNLYVAGTTAGALPSNTIHGSQDAFIARFPPNPTLGGAPKKGLFIQWGSNQSDEIRTARKISFCQNNRGKTFLHAAGDDAKSGKGWITRILPDTSSLATENTLPITGGSNWIGGLAADSTCNAYLGGWSKNAPHPTIRNEFFFLKKYDPALNAKIWETDGPINKGGLTLPQDFVHTVAVDSANNVYVAGTTMGKQVFLGNTIYGSDSTWYAVYRPDAELATGQPLRILMGILGTGAPGSAIVTEGNALAVGPTGEIYLAGQTTGALEGTQTDTLFSDAYLASFKSVTPQPTTTYISASPNPATVTSVGGLSIPARVAVSALVKAAPGAAKGTVKIFDNGNNTGKEIKVVAGSGGITLAFPKGKHVLTGVFTSDVLSSAKSQSKPFVEAVK